MSEKKIMAQIDALNAKMDMVLETAMLQRQKTESVEDLFSDLSIIGKDFYDTAVVELENQKVEIDIDEIKLLGIKLLNNISSIRQVVSMFESIIDLTNDLGPIVNQSIIDFTKKLNEFEQKGYFEFFNEAGKIIDNIVSHFSKDDVAQLAENVVTILETVKSMTQPEMLNAMNNAVKIYGSMETENIKEYSMFGLLREMNKPEMKQAMGFMVTFMKNLSAKQ